MSRKPATKSQVVSAWNTLAKNVEGISSPTDEQKQLISEILQERVDEDTTSAKQFGVVARWMTANQVTTLDAAKEHFEIHPRSWAFAIAEKVIAESAERAFETMAGRAASEAQRNSLRVLAQLAEQVENTRISELCDAVYEASDIDPALAPFMKLGEFADQATASKAITHAMKSLGVTSMEEAVENLELDEFNEAIEAAGLAGTDSEDEEDEPF